LPLSQVASPRFLIISIEIVEFHFWNRRKTGAANRGSTGFRHRRSIKLLPTNRINARAIDFACSLRTTAAVCGTD
jgi:hypothetical protein